MQFDKDSVVAAYHRMWHIRAAHQGLPHVPPQGILHVTEIPWEQNVAIRCTLVSSFVHRHSIVILLDFFGIK